MRGKCVESSAEPLYTQIVNAYGRGYLVKKAFLLAAVISGLLGAGIAGIAMGNRAVGGDEPAIMVSPSTIVLAKVDTVTVHTNIAASDVAPGSLDLDGAAPIDTGVDDCGHIVAKFAVEDLGLESGEVTLTLNGALEDGSLFSASDEAMVK